MRNLEYTARFKRDLRRELKGQLRDVINIELDDIVILLRNDSPLPVRLKDHPLTGNRQNERDLHIRPDLVLIYSRPAPDTLLLIRLGSHSELEL